MTGVVNRSDVGNDGESQRLIWQTGLVESDIVLLHLLVGRQLTSYRTVMMQLMHNVSEMFRLCRTRVFYSNTGGSLISTYTTSGSL